jgi:selenide,water dikinase
VLPAGFEDWRRDLLTDPQTSGGLLIAADERAAQRVLAMAREAGFENTAVVGRLATGKPGVVVR